MPGVIILGTPQKLINKDATVGWAANYQAYGFATPTTELITNPLRFPGQYYDQESGLHQNFMRDYDPRIGAYKTQDPIDVFQTGSNRYGYVYGNPVHLKDPTGSIALPFPHPGALVAGPLIVILYPPLRDFFNNVFNQIFNNDVPTKTLDETTPTALCMPDTQSKRTCSDALYNELEDLKDLYCKTLRAECKSHWTKERIEEQIRIREVCITLRNRITQECFGGIPHEGHENNIREQLRGLEKCKKLLN